MKHYLLLFLLFCFCSHAFAQPSPVAIKPLAHYFIDNRVTLERGLNCMVIAKKKDFNKLFGIGKTQTDTITAPDFNKETVLVLALPPDNKDATLKFINALKAGYWIDVNIEVKKFPYPLTYNTYPLAIVVIPRYAGITLIKFYSSGHLVKEVKVK